MEDNKLEQEENLVEEVKEDTKVTKEKKEELENSKVVKEKGFLKRFLASIIDQILSVAISLLLLVVFDAIIKLIGYQVADREAMFLIMYIITNVLYRPILKATKLKETIGSKLVK